MQLTEINPEKKNCCLLCFTMIIQFGLHSGDLKLQHVHSAAFHSPQIPSCTTGQRNSPCTWPYKEAPHLQPWEVPSKCSSLLYVPSQPLNNSFLSLWVNPSTEFWPESSAALPAQPLTIPAELNFSICSPGKGNAVFLLFKSTLSHRVRNVCKCKSQVPKDPEVLSPFLNSPCTSRALQQPQPVLVPLPQGNMEKLQFLAIHTRLRRFVTIQGLESCRSTWEVKYWLRWNLLSSPWQLPSSSSSQFIIFPAPHPPSSSSLWPGAGKRLMLPRVWWKWSWRGVLDFFSYPSPFINQGKCYSEIPTVGSILNSVLQPRQFQRGAGIGHPAGRVTWESCGMRIWGAGVKVFAADVLIPALCFLWKYRSKTRLLQFPL